jgi:hypothetical protein
LSANSLPIFEPLDAANHWRPSALAAGPFAGLQGGAVASLLTAEVEAIAAQRKWGTAVSVTAWFLRPTPMANLRTQLSVVTEGGRVSVIDNTLWPIDAEQPSDPVDPTRFPVRTRKAAHGRPWFMDAMDARAGDDVAWFRLHHPIIAGAGPLSSVLGPADWTHGIARPLQDVVADPNPNLTVQLFRPPSGEWVGVRAQTRWRPAAGCGVGSGTLLDVRGEIGRVSMSVVLVPFPKAAAAAG